MSEFVVSGFQPSKLFELIEESLDEVERFVAMPVDVAKGVRSMHLARALIRQVFRLNKVENDLDSANVLDCVDVRTGSAFTRFRDYVGSHRLMLGRTCRSG